MRIELNYMVQPLIEEDKWNVDGIERMKQKNCSNLPLRIDKIREEEREPKEIIRNKHR